MGPARQERHDGQEPASRVVPQGTHGMMEKSAGGVGLIFTLSSEDASLYITRARGFDDGLAFFPALFRSAAAVPRSKPSNTVDARAKRSRDRPLLPFSSDFAPLVFFPLADCRNA